MSPVLVPVGVRGMTVLDREKFSQKIQVPVLKVKSYENLSMIAEMCKSYFLKINNFKPLQPVKDDGEFKRIMYLNPQKVTKWTDIGEQVRDKLEQHCIDEDNFGFEEIEIGYENLNSEAIFKAVLPENEETVSGYSQVGHIILLNLRDHLFEYRYLIGQVLLDKLKKFRTVVNKTYVMDNTYRNFSLEIIAGEEDLFVTVKENNCYFEFDFSKVYWNPRLAIEHERMVRFLKPYDVLFDVFCGVGPFAIPAVKKDCKVFANDLNPECYKWLNHNAVGLPYKQRLKLFSSNKDGKDFICEDFKEYIVKLCTGTEELKTDNKIHVTMNLPAIAVEFLKYFKGLINGELMSKFKYEIIVYVYCFVKENCSAIQLVSDNMGCDMTTYIQDIFHVRKVTSKKDMMRVAFKLTKDVLFDTNGGPPAKRLCVDNE